ncbi:uncharacterized protein LOC131860257 [Cryptomeria japonica]|uniref:uncharacterized protein LOC131860257 n=1 Tax=Cryptomeria japonica TaxID=3369 RepID=UPI0027DA3F32|nr:uncharacterized protein LOC131860257 [Cryptomeria japonica]
MTIGMSSFKALYGYEALSFIDLVFDDSKVPRAKETIQGYQDILKALKDNISQAQNQQKMYVDRHRGERTFQVGDLVFLRLQPYRQSCLKSSGAEKLKPLFYGPYKKELGQQIVTSPELPPLDEEGKLTLELEGIADWREKKLRNKTIREYLIKWKGLPLDDASWEDPALGLSAARRREKERTPPWAATPTAAAAALWAATHSREALAFPCGRRPI